MLPFRDWLRNSDADRAYYAETKRNSPAARGLETSEAFTVYFDGTHPHTMTATTLNKDSLTLPPRSVWTDGTPADSSSNWVSDYSRLRRWWRAHLRHG